MWCVVVVIPEFAPSLTTFARDPGGFPFSWPFQPARRQHQAIGGRPRRRATPVPTALHPLHVLRQPCARNSNRTSHTEFGSPNPHAPHLAAALAWNFFPSSDRHRQTHLTASTTPASANRTQNSRRIPPPTTPPQTHTMDSESVKKAIIRQALQATNMSNARTLIEVCSPPPPPPPTLCTTPPATSLPIRGEDFMIDE